MRLLALLSGQAQHSRKLLLLLLLLLLVLRCGCLFLFTVEQPAVL